MDFGLKFLKFGSSTVIFATWRQLVQTLAPSLNGEEKADTISLASTFFQILESDLVEPGDIFPDPSVAAKTLLAVLSPHVWRMAVGDLHKSDGFECVHNVFTGLGQMKIGYSILEVISPLLAHVLQLSGIVEPPERDLAGTAEHLSSPQILDAIDSLNDSEYETLQEIVQDVVTGIHATLERRFSVEPVEPPSLSYQGRIGKKRHKEEGIRMKEIEAGKKEWADTLAKRNVRRAAIAANPELLALSDVRNCIKKDRELSTMPCVRVDTRVQSLLDKVKKEEEQQLLAVHDVDDIVPGTPTENPQVTAGMPVGTLTMEAIGPALPEDSLVAQSQAVSVAAPKKRSKAKDNSKAAGMLALAEEPYRSDSMDSVEGRALEQGASLRDSADTAPGEAPLQPLVQLAQEAELVNATTPDQAPPPTNTEIVVPVPQHHKEAKGASKGRKPRPARDRLVVDGFNFERLEVATVAPASPSAVASNQKPAAAPQHVAKIKTFDGPESPDNKTFGRWEHKQHGPAEAQRLKTHPGLAAAFQGRGTAQASLWNKRGGAPPKAQSFAKAKSALRDPRAYQEQLQQQEAERVLRWQRVAQGMRRLAVRRYVQNWRS
jgi:hypothetical protein